MKSETNERKPQVIVVSAPSGTGKTTLNRRLMAEFDRFEISVSYTTRSQRPGETDGVHYHFVSSEVFQTLIQQGKMLEFAQVFGTSYGTSFDEIARITSLGKNVILEIDVQGWKQAKPKLHGAVSIFILPPTIKVLWDRLSSRGTETLEKRWRRLQTARSEIMAAELYDFFIINEDLDDAYRELSSLVVQTNPPTLGRHDGISHCQKLLGEFEEPWIAQIAHQLSTSSA
jgi:guanylate kinase